MSDNLAFTHMQLRLLDANDGVVYQNTQPMQLTVYPGNDMRLVWDVLGDQSSRFAVRVGPCVALDALQEEIGTWAERTFPLRSPASTLQHFIDEAMELDEAYHDIENGGGPDLQPDAEEAADCAILLLHYAHKRGFSLREAILEKMAVNRSRTWGDPDERGVVRHIAEEAAGE